MQVSHVTSIKTELSQSDLSVGNLFGNRYDIVGSEGAYKQLPI